jgi:hypothetical protein
VKKTSNREFTRSDASIRARVMVVGSNAIAGEVIEGVTEDLSMNGLFMKCESKLPLGTECEVNLTLEGSEQGIQIKIRGKISRIEQGAIAISFLQIEDDSLEHLRNLILYNSEEIDRVEQEFTDHVGLKSRGGPSDF